MSRKKKLKEKWVGMKDDNCGSKSMFAIIYNITIYFFVFLLMYFTELLFVSLLSAFYNSIQLYCCIYFPISSYITIWHNLEQVDLEYHSHHQVLNILMLELPNLLFLMHGDHVHCFVDLL